MDDPHVANPFYRHSDTWPRKGRRLIEAVAAAFKAAFLAASQRANNVPLCLPGFDGLVTTTASGIATTRRDDLYRG